VAHARQHQRALLDLPLYPCAHIDKGAPRRAHLGGTCGPVGDVPPPSECLRRLCELYGVVTRYHDALGTERVATRDALLQFIKDEDIPGVIFLSGDRHIHEINLKNDDETDYPLIEVTSSGLTHAWRNFPGEPNRFRFGPVFDDLGFGLIMIDWEAQPASITLQIRDRDNTVTNSMTLPIMVLRPQAEGK